MTTCECGHQAYAGFVAEADALAPRLAWLTDRIEAGDRAPDPEFALRFKVWAPPGEMMARPPGGAAPAAGLQRRPAPSMQTILLGVGAMLLVVAGAVFAAVVWDRLGAVGQVILMVGATLGVGALAIRLRRRLAGTAEALAVVACGLAAVDVIAAPLLGLMPQEWITDPNLYPAIALGGLGGVLLLLHRRFKLRAWSWLGWGLMPIAAGCVVAAVASATGSGRWTAAAAVVPALVSVAMLAAPGFLPQVRDQRHAMQLAGSIGLSLTAVGTAAAAMVPSILPGAVYTTAATSLAVGMWAAAAGPRRGRLLTVGASALPGITVGLCLALPAEPQPAWLAAVVAVAGLGVGLATLRILADRLAAIVGASVVWLAWSIVRVSVATRQPDSGVDAQLCLLAALVAVMAFVLSWWLPAAAWVGALLAGVAMVLVPFELPARIESYSLPWAAVLLLAGILWRRKVACSSLVWLGPAVAVALIPSAVGTWLAPWALGDPYQSIPASLVRLVGVLIAGVAAVVVGARRRLAGLLIPGSVALVIAASAQVWSGIANLPRWIGLGLAGVLLIVAGARVEWLRLEGRRAIGWAEHLK